MDNLHGVLRTLKLDAKSRPAAKDHLRVFREFLGHLERVKARPANPQRIKTPRGAPKQNRKRAK